MADETCIQLPELERKKNFFKGWRSLLPLFLFALVVAIGYIYWWLATGDISSVYANVDAVIYTVEPEEPITIREVLVKKGDKVFPGQPLAMIEMAAPASQPGNNGSLHGLMPMGEITGRLDASEEAERGMSARLAQARAQEERFRQTHQNYVIEHVRAQLALRAIDPRDQVAWATASAQEKAARARMEMARVEFEKVSKMRAAMDTELTRIRTEIIRKKALASRSAIQQSPKPVEPPAPPKPVDTTLLAPANGKILEVFAAPGQQAQKGQSLFFILPADQGKTPDSWIQAWFPIEDQDNLQVGLPVAIQVEDLNFSGKVAAIAPEAQLLPNAGADSDGGTKRYILAKIAVDDPQALAEIAPGSLAHCLIRSHSMPWLDRLLNSLEK